MPVPAPAPAPALDTGFRYPPYAPFSPDEALAHELSRAAEANPPHDGSSPFSSFGPVYTEWMRVAAAVRARERTLAEALREVVGANVLGQRTDDDEQMDALQESAREALASIGAAP